MSKGTQCTGLHLVLYGQIKLAFISPEGNEKVLEILGQGQTFGEAPMFLEQPYLMTVQALTDATLLHISKLAIFEGLRRNSVFGRRMIAALSRRLHQVMTDVESYSFQSASQRVVRYLLRQLPEADQSGTATIALTVNKGTIASHLNLTQEHFSRVLSELSGLGFIVVDRRRITIADPPRLRAYVA